MVIFNLFYIDSFHWKKYKSFSFTLRTAHKLLSFYFTYKKKIYGSEYKIRKSIDFDETLINIGRLSITYLNTKTII